MDSQSFYQQLAQQQFNLLRPSSLVNDDIEGSKPKISTANKNTNHYHDKLKERYIGIGYDDIEYRPFRKQAVINSRGDEDYEIRNVQKKHFDVHLDSRAVRHNVFQAHGNNSHVVKFDYPRNLWTRDIEGTATGTMRTKGVRNHELAEKMRMESYSMIANERKMNLDASAPMKYEDTLDRHQKNLSQGRSADTRSFSEGRSKGHALKPYYINGNERNIFTQNYDRKKDLPSRKERINPPIRTGIGQTRSYLDDPSGDVQLPLSQKYETPMPVNQILNNDQLNAKYNNDSSRNNFHYSSQTRGNSRGGNSVRARKEYFPVTSHMDRIPTSNNNRGYLPVLNTQATPQINFNIGLNNNTWKTLLEQSNEIPTSGNQTDRPKSNKGVIKLFPVDGNRVNVSPQPGTNDKGSSKNNNSISYPSAAVDDGFLRSHADDVNRRLLKNAQIPDNSVPAGVISDNLHPDNRLRDTKKLYIFDIISNKPSVKIVSSKTRTALHYGSPVYQKN